MLYQLAFDLGYTVGDLRDRITLQEVNGWMLFYKHRKAVENGTAPAPETDWSDPGEIKKAFML